MAIRVDQAHTDAVLLFINQSAQPGFLGYELERRSDSADWQGWNGTGWGGAASLLATNRFTDYSMAPGLFQYRVRARLESTPGVISFSAWDDSSWIRVAGPGSERAGWTLGNYVIPEGEFGAVLTTDDLRSTYLWGIPFTSSNGLEYTDAQIQSMIDAAVAEYEHVLNISIYRRKIMCADDISDMGAVQYDELEDAYAYHRSRWNNGGRLNTKRRPIISVERLDLYTLTQGKIMDLLPWVRVDHKKGVIHFYPRQDKSGVMRTWPPILSGAGYIRPLDYNHAYRLAYTVGYEDAGKIPADLRDIIGKTAACRLLNIIGDGLIAGFSSMSLGLDGLSESFSTTQSATNAMYGARINQYVKEIETWLKQNIKKFGSYPMGFI